MRLTSFTITDATLLEEEEKPIPQEVESKMKNFLQLSSVRDLFHSPSAYNVPSIDIELIDTLFPSFTFTDPSGQDAHAVGNR